MWCRHGICVVLTILSLGASSDDHCIGGKKSTNETPGVALLQHSFAPGRSVVSKLAEHESKSLPSAIASALVSESDAGSNGVVQRPDPENELSKTSKMVFVVSSAFILLAVGSWVCKMIQDYEAASSISTPSWYTDPQMLSQISFLMLSTWFSLGLTAFTQVILFSDPPRHLTLIEAMYLSSQIVTTVGYGDFTPTHPEGQVFVACYILVGVSLVAILIGELLDRAASHSGGAPLAAGLGKSLFASVGTEPEERGEGSEDAENHTSAEADPKAHGATASLSSGLSPSKPLSCGSWSARVGGGDHHGHQRQPMKVLARAVLVFVIAAVAGTLFFRFYPGEGKTIWLAFYMSCVTLTSVGFGATHPVTQGGYLFATVWMLIGVSCTANMICTFADFLMMQRKDLTSDLMKDELLKAMDTDGSGTVDKIEFLKFELVRNGTCQMHEIDTVLDLFEYLDTDGSGELDLEDVKLFAARKQPLRSEAA